MKTAVGWNGALNFWGLLAVDICCSLVPSPPLELMAFLPLLALLFLSILGHWWVCFPAFEVSDLRALRAPEAGGAHLFSCWWLSLPSALEAYESGCSRGTAPPDGWGAGAERRAEMDEQMVSWWKGSSLLIPHLLKHLPTWRCPCISLKDKDSGHVLRTRMSNLKDKVHHDLTSRLLFLDHFVILVDENYTSFKMVVTGLIHSLSPLLLESMS